VVEKKSRIGDWEIDTVIGKGYRGVLVTLAERKSKFALIGHAPSREAEEVTQVTLELLEPLKQITHTITSDNGKEFTRHQEIAKALEADFYFVNPHHSWERGLNKRTPHVHEAEIAEALGLSTRAVEKQMATLKKAGRVRRIGSARKGHWEVME
jgi:IS30 family transposase